MSRAASVFEGVHSTFPLTLLEYRAASEDKFPAFPDCMPSRTSRDWVTMEERRTEIDAHLKPITENRKEEVSLNSF